MMDIEEVVATYCAAWNEEDDALRESLLHKSWSENGIYEDPTAVVLGRKNLKNHIGQFQKTYPGCEVLPTSRTDRHTNKLHFTWKVIKPGGDVVLQGRDFCELDSDGRISHIVGFFGTLQPL